MGGILGELLECNRGGTLLFELLRLLRCGEGEGRFQFDSDYFGGRTHRFFFQVWMARRTCWTRILLTVTFTPGSDFLLAVVPTYPPNEMSTMKRDEKCGMTCKSGICCTSLTGTEPGHSLFLLSNSLFSAHRLPRWPPPLQIV
jgi:hypothetical protein